MVRSDTKHTNNSYHPQTGDINKTNQNTLPQAPTKVSFVYSDAAWNGTSSAGGLSWVCTYSAGNERFQGTDARRYIASALVAEVLAMKKGLSKAVSAGLKDIICCSDSRCLIDTIT